MLNHPPQTDEDFPQDCRVLSARKSKVDGEMDGCESNIWLNN